MGFARAADVPVVMVGDIDRGGVIASLVGTRAVLDADDAAMVRGFIVNKFRGDPALFADGMAHDRRGDRLGGARPGAVSSPTRIAAGRGRARPVVESARAPARHARLRIAVPILPHVSNFDDLDPLEAEPEVEVVKRLAGHGAAGRCRPGDPARLEVDHRRSRGAARSRLRHRHRGASCGAAAMCSGLCGGYQMLGRRLHDPDGVEGPAASVDGLGLLDVETRLTAEKRLVAVTGATADGSPFSGYEMHMGATEGPDRARPFAQLADATPEGAVSADGRVIGHLCPRAVRRRPPARRGWRGSAPSGGGFDYEAGVDETLDGLAAHLEKHVDLDRLIAHAAMTAAATRPISATMIKIGGAIERQRAADVGGIGLAPAAGAHLGVVDQHAAIVARAGERQAERAGHRRLRPAGIGRAMLSRVAQHGAPGVLRPRRRQ